MLKTVFCISLSFIVRYSYAQVDSSLHTVQQTNANIQKKADEKMQEAEDLKQVPDKYVKDVNDKMDLYNKRMTAKTIKTLQKLSKYEDKIHTLLLKTSPQIAQQLFGNGQETFSTLLQKMQQGQSIGQNYRTQYNAYTDKLSTNLKYLQQQKGQLDSNIVKPVADANSKMAAVTTEEDNTEAVQQFIKQRKKQLADGAMKYLQNSPYLAKMNEENYYYVETLKNYKELFSDPDKTEKAAMDMVDKIPAFQAFTQQNSMLASLFGSPAASGNAQTLTGLQSRADIQTQLGQTIASGGPSAQQEMMQNMQQAQSQLNQLKNQVGQGFGNSSSVDMPQGFTPDMQKTKTFMQRLEYGANLQSVKGDSWLPATTDMALTLGYKLNDKSSVGLGASYKLGMGTIQNISFSSQGVGLRSYLDWKLKKQLYISGGFEMNNYPVLNGAVLPASGFTPALKLDSWQQSCLLGFTKKMNVKTKISKSTNIQLLYDLLWNQHTPQSQPVLFRIGYNF